MADPTVEQEVKKQIYDAVARIPWILSATVSGDAPDVDKVSTEELLRGTQLLVIELARIAERLAREIDQLKGRGV